MTKKRLADMLKAELQKSPEPKVEIVPEIKDDRNLESVSIAPAESSVGVQQTFQDAVVTQESPMNPPAKPSARRRTTNPANADLEVTVTNLREDLKEAQQKESSLQQQINDLQTALQEQQTSLNKLQDDQEQTNYLKSRVEEVKQDALHLAEVNDKLNQEIATLRKENEELKAQLAHGSQQKLAKLGQEQITKSPDSKPLDNFQSWCYD